MIFIPKTLSISPKTSEIGDSPPPRVDAVRSYGSSAQETDLVMYRYEKMLVGIRKSRTISVLSSLSETRTRGPCFTPLYPLPTLPSLQIIDKRADPSHRAYHALELQVDRMTWLSPQIHLNSPIRGYWVGPRQAGFRRFRLRRNRRFPTRPLSVQAKERQFRRLGGGMTCQPSKFPTIPNKFPIKWTYDIGFLSHIDYCTHIPFKQPCPEEYKVSSSPPGYLNNKP